MSLIAIKWNETEYFAGGPLYLPTYTSNKAFWGLIRYDVFLCAQQILCPITWYQALNYLFIKVSYRDMPSNFIKKSKSTVIKNCCSS